MIRFILFVLVLHCFVFAKGETDKKIAKTSSKISSYSKNYTNINKKMEKTATAILKKKREVVKQNIFLKELKKELLNKESSYKTNKNQLLIMKKSQKELKLKQEKIEQKLSYVIAKSVSLSIILDQDNSENVESLIEYEVLKEMLKASKKEAENLSKEFFSNAQDIELLHRHTSYLETEIATIDSKRKKLINVQELNKKSIEELTLSKLEYKQKLQNVLGRQNTLKKTLAKLNIVKIDEIKKAKIEEERKIAFENKKIILQEDLPKVKKHGSSYQVVKTKKYKGKKTIAPLDSYTITKEYGTYTDPIYGIKIFNNSISLKPKRNGAKVKTVFNGKVIYADKTAVLNNIVIVEHSGGLHTIYANLSQISPDIKKGKKIRKGYTIGRVDDELIFEVTQKSYHINPIRLFK
ncbi:peptidoglycan DD-metalloendopeptidase family protein [Sulfurimonas sp.]|jgi:murein DD-endopeptidase MepM/ murein hydrolase activator NlpD|uniref:murein hydrolase activator EnvC family protein n=1 Tax=Sulfurimonas sp. TaxID=2022749 RepID=UPI0025FC0C51|nr:peptidoglycan DD-metalloendopeptidase family protein [Sulfurimonas sp.]MBT5935472.1 peptidoglycan DD-metalloendopeptidase family protein [Sulfurimonas sp.]